MTRADEFAEQAVAVEISREGGDPAAAKGAARVPVRGGDGVEARPDMASAWPKKVWKLS
jgi:hypothetical protein